MFSCGGCDNQWGGLAEAHCSLCHHTFSVVRNFDKHFGKAGECVAPALVRVAGQPALEPRIRALGTVWVGVGEPEPFVSASDSSPRTGKKAS